MHDHVHPDLIRPAPNCQFPLDIVIVEARLFGRYKGEHDLRLSHARLQEYVNHRARKGASPVTIRKEIATLRAAWNWGGPMKLTP